MRMQPMVARPYGSWTSPITSDLVVAEATRLDQVALDGTTIYWTESQPQKQGRSFVYRAPPRGQEAGGGAFAGQDGPVYFSTFADQRLYRQDAAQPPRPLTPAGAAGA